MGEAKEKINISVIVPVYNVESYLQECVDSLLAQDVPGLELIFVNDGSTDGSRGILEEYSRRHDNIIVIDQENSGQSVAKNNGIKVASGKYISFVDADDIMMEGALRVLFDKAEQNSCPMVVGGVMLYWAETGRMKRYDNLHVSENRKYSGKEVCGMLLREEMHCVMHAKIYRRDCWLEHGVSFPAGQIYEDMLPAFSIVMACGECMFVDRPCYKYRMREDSSVAVTTPKKVRDLLKSLGDVKRFVLDNNIVQDESDPLLMSFDVNYGIYATQLNSRLTGGEDFSQEIDRLKHPFCKVLLSSSISVKNKVKYLFCRIGMLYKKKNK